MDLVTIQKGDLLDAQEKYIMHQCNCVSLTAKILAKQIFDKFDYADTYKKRIRGNKNTYSSPGTIEILGDGTDKRFIINAYSQFYPSVSKYPCDSKQKRLFWFGQCLNQIAKIENLESVAMPFKIGCGTAGGDWNDYFETIKGFAYLVQIPVVLHDINL